MFKEISVYWYSSIDRYFLFCIDCKCYEIGTKATKKGNKDVYNCGLRGVCECLPGYRGDKCYSCEEDYYKTKSTCTGETSNE